MASLNSPTVTTVLLNLVKNAIDALMEVDDGRQKRIEVSLETIKHKHTFVFRTTGMAYRLMFVQSCSSDLPL